MGANYDWISGSPDLEILGPTASREVMRVEVQAQPSGVVWAMNFPLEDFTEAKVASTLERLSRGFNAAAQNPHVEALSTSQEVNRNNQYVELVNITVSSSSGKTVQDYRQGYALIELPPGGAGDSIFSAWVAERVAELDAIETA